MRSVQKEQRGVTFRHGYPAYSYEAGVSVRGTRLLKSPIRARQAIGSVNRILENGADRQRIRWKTRKDRERNIPRRIPS